MKSLMEDRGKSESPILFTIASMFGRRSRIARARAFGKEEKKSREEGGEEEGSRLALFPERPLDRRGVRAL